MKTLSDVAWARLSVEHETLYEYASPVEQAQHVACLRPLSDAGQHLEVFEMAVSPTPSQHSMRRDSHDNSRAYFALHAPHTELKVVARSEVRVCDRYEGLDPECGPTCDAVRERLAYRAHAPFEPAAEYLYTSPFVPLHAELREYASLSLQEGRPLAAAAIDLMRRIHADFDYAPASTDISTPILDVFDRRKGVCQDFAHLMLGCLRACGLSARYVSGYLLTRPPPGQAPLVGADASHAWVSVWVPGLGPERAGDWLDLDPTNNCIPGVHHVRVAHGRDFGDVTPLRGVIRGGGQHTLLVRVTTRLLQEPAAAAA
ncbi:transglutaminase family protein [uncultured Aquabacterium sp.]|uniref:transglutaminase family protein n=1 Tax=Aquabacterium sp. TaxID=1872578 RepID=UPI0025E91779|nr:transglutaminase family protein [uncultured Aquabacterium sp.]